MGLVKCSGSRYRLPLLTVILVFLYILTPLSRVRNKLWNFTLVNFFEHNLSTKEEAEANKSKYSFLSMCSHTADTRGPHQKVISYSLYGNLSRIEITQKYFAPLIKTIDEIPQIYPGWIVRIYHNSTNDRELVSLLRSHVDLCNVTQIARTKKMGNLFAMTWRWLPLLDEMVDSLMSRDSDSRIVPREVEAVQEWLDSHHIFHIMRDHPAHCLFGFIMGGCWGVKISEARSEIAHATIGMYTHDHLHQYDYDQILLDKFIWPLAKNNVLAHDSYCCTKMQPTQPFPQQRKDRLFVGARAIFNSTRTEELGDMEECPIQCRQFNYVSSKLNFC